MKGLRITTPPICNDKQELVWIHARYPKGKIISVTYVENYSLIHWTMWFSPYVLIFSGSWVPPWRGYLRIPFSSDLIPKCAEQLSQGVARIFKVWNVSSYTLNKGCLNQMTALKYVEKLALKHLLCPWEISPSCHYMIGCRPYDMHSHTTFKHRRLIMRSANFHLLIISLSCTVNLNPDPSSNNLPILATVVVTNPEVIHNPITGVLRLA